MSQYKFNRNFAIIIGINKYKNGIRELETAVPDAYKLALILQSQHKKLQKKYQDQNRYEVQLILNERANLHKLKQLIEFLWNGNPYLDLLNKELQKDENWFNKLEAEFVQQSVLQKRRNNSLRWRRSDRHHTSIKWFNYLGINHS